MSKYGKYNCRRLEGKVAVVTASTKGIGFAIAERLGHEGAKVVVSSRKKAYVEEAVKKLKADGLDVEGVVCHVAEADDREKLFEKAVESFGGIDILISNAAVNPSFGSIFDTPEEAWDKVFEVNVKATFLLCKEVIPYMEKRNGGSIVLVSSIAGYTPQEVIGAYSISKTALFGMTKAMVPECVKRNIRINCIAPGIIKTKFTQPGINKSIEALNTAACIVVVLKSIRRYNTTIITSETVWETKELESQAEFLMPMRRLGRADECASAVAFLVSEDASYITGETIVMSGGAQSRL